MRIFNLMDRLGLLMMALSLAGYFATPIMAEVPLASTDKSCVYPVTPSSVTASQFNTTTTLASVGGACTYYSRVCFAFETGYSTNTVYVSSSITKADGNGWPVFGNTTQCHDWGPNVKLFYSLKSGCSQETNSFKFLLSR